MMDVSGDELSGSVEGLTALMQQRQSQNILDGLKDISKTCDDLKYLQEQKGLYVDLRSDLLDFEGSDEEFDSRNATNDDGKVIGELIITGKTIFKNIGLDYFVLISRRECLSFLEERLVSIEETDFILENKLNNLVRNLKLSYPVLSADLQGQTKECIKNNELESLFNSSMLLERNIQTGDLMPSGVVTNDAEEEYVFDDSYGTFGDEMMDIVERLDDSDKVISSSVEKVVKKESSGPKRGKNYRKNKKKRERARAKKNQKVERDFVPESESGAGGAPADDEFYEMLSDMGIIPGSIDVANSNATVNGTAKSTVDSSSTVNSSTNPTVNGSVNSNTNTAVNTTATVDTTSTATSNTNTTASSEEINIPIIKEVDIKDIQILGPHVNRNSGQVEVPEYLKYSDPTRPAIDPQDIMEYTDLVNALEELEARDSDVDADADEDDPYHVVRDIVETELLPKHIEYDYEKLNKYFVEEEDEEVDAADLAFDEADLFDEAEFSIRTVLSEGRKESLREKVDAFLAGNVGASKQARSRETASEEIVTSARDTLNEKYDGSPRDHPNEQNTPPKHTITGPKSPVSSLKNGSSASRNAPKKTVSFAAALQIKEVESIKLFNRRNTFANMAYYMNVDRKIEIEIDPVTQENTEFNKTLLPCGFSRASADEAATDALQLSEIDSILSETVNKLSGEYETVSKLSGHEDALSKQAGHEDTLNKLSGHEDTLNKLTGHEDTLNKLTGKHDTLNKLTGENHTLSKPTDSKKKVSRFKRDRSAGSSKRNSLMLSEMSSFAVSDIIVENSDAAVESSAVENGFAAENDCAVSDAVFENGERDAFESRDEAEEDTCDDSFNTQYQKCIHNGSNFFTADELEEGREYGENIFLDQEDEYGESHLSGGGHEVEELEVEELEQLEESEEELEELEEELEEVEEVDDDDEDDYDLGPVEEHVFERNLEAKRKRKEQLAAEDRLLSEMVNSEHEFPEELAKSEPEFEFPEELANSEYEFPEELIKAINEDKDIEVIQEPKIDFSQFRTTDQMAEAYMLGLYDDERDEFSSRNYQRVTGLPIDYTDDSHSGYIIEKLEDFAGYNEQVEILKDDIADFIRATAQSENADGQDGDNGEIVVDNGEIVADNSEIVADNGAIMVDIVENNIEFEDEVDAGNSNNSYPASDHADYFQFDSDYRLSEDVLREDIAKEYQRLKQKIIKKQDLADATRDVSEHESRQFEPIDESGNAVKKSRFKQQRIRMNL